MGCIDKAGQELYTFSKDFGLEALSPGRTAENIKAALKASGKGRQRRSPLQPQLMIWLVLCLPIFRSESIPAVLGRLLSGLRGRRKTLSLKPVGDDAIAHARGRLGIAPLRHFYRAQAAEIRPAASFHGLRVWSLDGTSLSMPDTKENRQIFGLRNTSRGRCAYPELKMVALQDVESRQFKDVRWNLRDASERALGASLLTHLEEGDLALVDRGFYAGWFFLAVRARRSHFLARVPAYAKLRRLRGTSRHRGDYLAYVSVRVPLPKGQKIQGVRGHPFTHQIVRLLVRVIEYRLPGFQRVRLTTSLLDPEITAREWVLEYHRRWDIELALDELKTHQSSTAQGALKTIFRSHNPRNVMQEAYALAASYNLLRQTIALAAHGHSLDPDKISFIGSYRAIMHMLPRMQGALAQDLPSLYEQLLSDICEALIDRPRRPRRYPRVVKQKMSNFKLKRPKHRQILIDFRDEIRIGA